MIEVKKMGIDGHYHMGREDEREHSKKKLLEAREECCHMEEVVDAIKSL